MNLRDRIALHLSENIEDRRKHPVPPALGTGPFGAGLPIPNVFAGSGGLMTELDPNEDFMPMQDTPLSSDAGAPILQELYNRKAGM